MVRRMMNDQDKRSHHLYLSSKGQEVKERLLLTVKEAHDHVTRGLEPDELDQLKVTLDKLYRNVRED